MGEQDKDMTSALVAFCLNEEEALRVILPRIKKEWVDELIVLDGHSSDGTAEYCKEHGYRLCLQERLGMDSVLAEAVDFTTSDVIVMFTPDGNSIPEKIPEIIDKMREGYDLVIASRYLPPASSEDDDPVTAFGNWMFTKIINFLFRGKVTDSLVGYFALRRELFEELKIGDTDSWGPRLLMRCMKKKKRIGEISADEPKRIGGERKMNPLRNGWWVLRTIIHEFIIGNRY